MYGIFTYIWLIFMVNVGRYTIHGSYGLYVIYSLYPVYPSSMLPGYGENGETLLKTIKFRC